MLRKKIKNGRQPPLMINFAPFRTSEVPSLTNKKLVAHFFLKAWHSDWALGKAAGCSLKCGSGLLLPAGEICVVTPFKLNFHLVAAEPPWPGWLACVVKWDSKVAQRALKLTSSCQNEGEYEGQG